MSELPTGTVTFLFTDVEGSTRLWEQHPDAMRGALARHDELITAAVEHRGGRVVKGLGDGIYAAFAIADAAVASAVDAQRTLNMEPWEPIGSLRVRMGLHTGVADQRDADYFGPVLNRAARLMGAGHGGQILLSAATQELVRDHLPEGCGLIELGSYRLRDLGRPERIFQVVHRHLQRDFERLRTLDTFPGNLPLQTSSLVGRESDVVRVSEATVLSPVVTLTGVGGVGKTRLALQVAAEELPRYRDGAWLCELQMVRDPAGVVDAVAGVFRVTARVGSALEEALVGYLRDQELLLVLDNCEHLLRPVADLVAKIEESCPRVRVLATSREGLNLRGEQILVVPSLAVGDEGMEVGALIECEAVRLFSDRARAVKADFHVEPSNASAVGEVCRRLDGVPLAIELAAARVVTMTPAELAKRLDRRFRLLTGGERVAIERHQTLRATIDWSFELLTEPQQRLLARLSVFVGGWTLEAAEEVCSGHPIEADEVLDLLAGLVARSLVVVDDAGVETRYRLLETIRQYGEEALAKAGESEVVRRGHANHYAEFTVVVGDHIWGPEQIEWAARLARERDNLLIAMAYALQAKDVDLAFRLFCPLPHGSIQINAIVHFDPAPLMELPGATNHPGSAVALLEAAMRAWYIDGDAARALQLAEQAVDVERRLGRAAPQPVEAWSLNLRSQLAQASDDAEGAIGYLVEATKCARTDNAPGLAAQFLGISAHILAWTDPDRARQFATEGLELARQSGVPIEIGQNLVGLADTLVSSEPDRARVLLHEGLELAVGAGYESFGSLGVAVLTAARLEEWTAMLDTARRALKHQLLTGGLGVIYVASLLNVVAFALVSKQPEGAAVIQGSVKKLLERLSADIAAPVRGDSTEQNDVARYVVAVRQETTRRLTVVLGAERVRELRAQGAAMDETEAYTYARSRIDEHLDRTTGIDISGADAAESREYP